VNDRPADLPARLDRRALAAEVWRLVVDFGASRRGPVLAILRRLGLTPGHMKALLALHPEEPRSMGSLARALACDASTVTWLVDGLEARGLAQRRAHPTDRRVRTLALTPRGARVRARLVAQLYDPPAELASLDVRALRILRDALARAFAHPPPSTRASRRRGVGRGRARASR
jgi:DNA-binding MarR family transcriptional regulator